MTCIVGLVDKGKVYIGGDSAGVDARLEMSVRRDRKVFRNGEFVMGFTTSFRMGQILAFAFTPPKPREGEDLLAYMVKDFIPVARTAMKDGGYSKIEHHQEEGGTFLVGFRGRLFRVDADFQVGENQLPFDACGCGQSIALGSLFSSGRLTPRARLVEALRAAESFSAGVRAPFVIEVTR